MESIFNLVDAHSKSTKRNTLLPQHVVLYSAEEGSSDATSPATRLPPIKNRGIQSQGEPRSTTQKRELSRIATRAASAGREEDAAEVARRRQLLQMRGGDMAAALAPEHDNPRARMARAGIDVKDHTTDYKSKLKEQSIINGLMRAQGVDPQTRPAARKPEFTGRPQQLDQGQANFVEENKQRVLDHAGKLRDAAAQAKAKPPKYAGPESERVAGRLPRYLVERKVEMEVQRAMEQEEAERRKGGPKAMPEEERLATLAELQQQKKAALLELNSIPISKTELPVYQAQIRKLEARLTEVDAAILLFSRKVVLVQ